MSRSNLSTRFELLAWSCTRSQVVPSRLLEHRIQVRHAVVACARRPLARGGCPQVAGIPPAAGDGSPVLPAGHGSFAVLHH